MGSETGGLQLIPFLFSTWGLCLVGDLGPVLFPSLPTDAAQGPPSSGGDWLLQWILVRAGKGPQMA